MGEWLEVPFAEAIDFQEGPGIMAADFRDDGVPLIRLAGLERGGTVLAGCNFLDPSTVQRRWAHFALREGDILLSSSASLGRIAAVGAEAEGAIPYTGIIRMRPRDERVHAPFIRYLLEAPDFQRQAEIAGVGSVMRHFGPMHLRQMTVSLPPVGTQRRIAGILGALDEKIELNRRTSETLEATARALFRRWFLRPEASRDWPIEPLAAHLEVIRGLSYKGDGLASTGVPLHNLNSVYEGGGYKPDGIKWYSGPYAERHTVEPGDVIVTNTEQGHDRLLIGHAALVPGSFGRLGLFSHHLYRVRPRPGSVLSRSFVTYLLNSQAMHDLVSGYSNGTTVQMLPVEALQQPAIRIPPASLIRRFDALATISHQRQEIARGEARALAMLRDALLPRLLSGPTRETA